MKLLKKITMFGLLAGFGVSSLADNPISTYHYLADPGAAADDEYFYIITDSDDPAPYNSGSYEIFALYGFRSKDMQNWTDFGIIYDARKVNGIGAIWASGIAVDPKSGTLYIVFPDGGGGGIGYIKAPGIDGPWTNAVGQGKDKLVGGRGIIGCDGVSWCFDPGIFIDDDGTTYVTWGGGESNSRPNTDNFDIVKLNDAKDAPVGNGSHVKVNNLPTRKMLEASYIHKHGNTYYFSYSTGWQQGAPTIDYGTSNNVMGPYTWKGTILGDPSMNGRSINGNNNHHGIAEFKGHSYVVYHDRRIAKGHNGLEVIPADDGRPNPNEGYHRSVSVDEMFYNADGTIKQVVCTNEGPEQIENFDPYDVYPALTSSKQKGIRSRSNFVQGKKAEHVLLPLSSKESWLRVSGVDFGTAATGFVVEAASAADNNKIEIRTGSATGTLAGTCTLKNTGSKTSYAETKCDVEGLKGIVKQLFLVFKGDRDSTMAIKSWGFEGSGSTPPEPQKPFGGKAAEIPGKIEMENFDEPGSGRGSEIKSYSDNDAEDHGIAEGDKSYREGTGVDIYKKATGYVVGYNQADEWLEYTVNIKEAGDYTVFASVATDNSTASFSLSVDDESVAEVSVSGSSWDDFVKVKTNVTLPAGEHILRFTVTGDWFDIDYLNFVKGKDAKDPEESSGDSTIAIHKGIRMDVASAATFDVFDLTGKKVASFTARSMLEAKKLWRENAQAKSVQGFSLIRNRSNGAVARVRSVR
ncbi:MAG: carbohydrate-binding protein [Fibrobacter sp.]|nr:carbohydrate-binding protein [Fibrobacter sp.]